MPAPRSSTRTRRAPPRAAAARACASARAHRVARTPRCARGRSACGSATARSRRRARRAGCSRARRRRRARRRAPLARARARAARGRAAARVAASSRHASASGRSPIRESIAPSFAARSALAGSARRAPRYSQIARWRGGSSVASLSSESVTCVRACATSASSIGARRSSAATHLSSAMSDALCEPAAACAQAPTRAYRGGPSSTPFSHVWVSFWILDLLEGDDGAGRGDRGRWCIVDTNPANGEVIARAVLDARGDRVGGRGGGGRAARVGGDAARRARRADQGGAREARDRRRCARDADHDRDGQGRERGEGGGRGRGREGRLHRARSRRRTRPRSSRAATATARSRSSCATRTAWSRS